MFTKSYCRTTLQLLLMWFGVACVYYGIILVQSELLEKGGICGGRFSELLIITVVVILIFYFLALFFVLVLCIIKISLKS